MPSATNTRHAFAGSTPFHMTVPALGMPAHQSAFGGPSSGRGTMARAWKLLNVWTPPSEMR
jgi:hypothetical protein